jgi:potassium/hydrogen antiporter
MTDVGLSHGMERSAMGTGLGARMAPLLPQTQVLSPLLIALPLPHAHLEGTLLPRGFFLGLGLIYLAALAVDRLAANWRLPGAAAVLLLGLVIPTDWLTQAQPLGPLQVESLHRVSLALLIFYAGLKTDLRRIRGMTAAGLRLGCGGVVITVAMTALALLLLAPLMEGGLPPAAAVLAVWCLGATDSGAIEDLLAALGHPIRGRLSHLLQFEVAVSTVVTLLGFGLVAGVLQAQPLGDQQALQGVLASRLPEQLGAVGLHLIAGLLAGLVVGVVAPRLIDALVRSEPMLLLVAVALAFVAFGFGQLLGGGGLLAVFVAGVLLSNGRYRIGRFEQQALGRVMHPLNTAAEITVLLLLGLLVKPAVLLMVLPLGLALAIVVPLARLLAVSALLQSARFPWPDRLVIAGCGLRAAVPLALAVSMMEALPHLRGVIPALAEPLGDQLLALLFVVVLADLVLQPLLMRRLLPISPEPSPP